MVAPEYISSLSLVENKTKIMGNTLLANQIREIVKLYINHNKDLYETQSRINAALISRFGIDWYERSKEAVNFIVKNEFAHKEREKHPFFDKRQYEADIKSRKMY